MNCTFNATHKTNCKLNFANTNIYIVLFSTLVDFSSSNDMSSDSMTFTFHNIL